MKLFRYMTLLLAGLSFLSVTAQSELNAEYAGWRFEMSSAKKLTVEQNGTKLFGGVTMTALDENDNELQSDNYTAVAITQADVNDEFGQGRRFTWTFTNAGSPSLEQIVTVYNGLPYALFEGAVVAQSGSTSSRQINPVVITTTNTLPLPTSENRIYNMPFANDNWATFATVTWSTGQPVTSCEATALFNVATRQGIVIGSVDHSVWKSSVTVTPTSTNRIRRLVANAGYVSPRTWDNGSFGNNSPMDKHGAVKGQRVVSSKFMIGFFDDWRTGLETYGKANTVLCPKLEMKTGDKALFGWQSWGGQEAQLNYTSTMSVLDFFEKEIKPTGFAGEDGVCWMVLDSFWDNMSRMERRQFAQRCKEMGYRPGIYHTPFSIWLGNDDEVSDYPYETVDGKTYTRKDVVLTANGKPRKISGYSLDPTHPAVKEANRKRFQEFKDDGFEFVKIDFMNNGSQEADSWYDPNVTTGMMAYNYGMDYILEMAGDMVLDFSIAPVFPAKAHIRRIGCDAWGELNNSMYTLNCINGSWWLDQCYSFNDPDHMCLTKVFTGKGSPDENEARIRYTCGLITGMTLLGGTYAYEGATMKYNNKDVKIVGTDAERARVVKFASNKDLTEVGRLGRSFRPVEGTFLNLTSLYATDDIATDNEFVFDTPEAFYYVVFNFSKTGSLEEAVDFDRLGINKSEFVNVKELWNGTNYTPESVKVSVPAKDVRIYRFERESYSGIDAVAVDNDNAVDMMISDGCISVRSSQPMTSIAVYGIDGRAINSINFTSTDVTTASLSAGTACGLAIVSVRLRSGFNSVKKLVLR